MKTQNMPSRFWKPWRAVAEMEKEDLPICRTGRQSPRHWPAGRLVESAVETTLEETGVAPKLIANVADLERIASDDEPDVAALHGWRHDIFGQYAEALKAGKLALASENDAVILVARADNSSRNFTFGCNCRVSAKTASRFSIIGAIKSLNSG